jgi:hypothetical protein
MKIGNHSLDNFSQPQPETKPPGTSFNPFRCSRRQIHFPRTPNLINPSPTKISPIPPAKVSGLASRTDLTHPTEINDAERADMIIVPVGSSGKIWGSVWFLKMMRENQPFIKCLCY